MKIVIEVPDFDTKECTICIAIAYKSKDYTFCPEIIKDHTAVSDKELDRLQEVEAFMDALKAAGVDNWDGYDIAKDYLEEWNK